jgi:hypothetical protein
MLLERARGSEEVRNILSEIGGKIIFVIWGQKFSSVVSYSYVESRTCK